MSELRQVGNAKYNFKAICERLDYLNRTTDNPDYRSISEVAERLISACDTELSESASKLEEAERREGDWHAVADCRSEEIMRLQQRLEEAERDIKELSEVGRELKPAPDIRGYLRVGLRIKERYKCARIHLLVAAAFIGPKPLGMQTMHLNGRNTDNNWTNLRYGTQSENEADKRKHGTAAVGERNGQAKLTWQLVAEIRQNYKPFSRSHSLIAMANRYSVDRAIILGIIHNRTWRLEDAPALEASRED